jgi:hypothetical protein
MGLSMKQLYPEDAETQRARELAEEDRYDLIVAAVHQARVRLSRRYRRGRAEDDLYGYKVKE